MTRDEAKRIGLAECAGHSDDEIFCCAPKPGKNVWTYGEYRKALINDECMEELSNPIDDILMYVDYINKKEQTEHQTKQ